MPACSQSRLAISRPYLPSRSSPQQLMASPIPQSVRFDSQALSHFTSADVFYGLSSHEHVSSRPSTSSSSSSYASSATASQTDSSQSSESLSCSSSWTSSTGLPCAYSSRPWRPLPTPPLTLSHTRSDPSPRPLPRPPLHRACSDGHPPRCLNPLPTPPTAPAPPPTTRPSLRQPEVRRRIAPAASEAIKLAIPGQTSAKSTQSLDVISTPSSPIAFCLPGPEDLRKRREEELSRRMRDLGFVESTPPPPPPKDAQANSRSKADLGRHTFSVSGLESDDDKDVVLLLEPSSSETEETPPRSKSRAAMLTLFVGVEDAQSTLEHGSVPPHEVALDVQIEVVAQNAVARTAAKRYSRKWVREKGGKRWTERDFSEILSELRRLR
ncbi:hypothetical protein BD414DRAFT_485461 [Trametes punicea]|nr:hypothetical protein BD414DRAFT_485461 [Trametes punicea]